MLIAILRTAPRSEVINKYIGRHWRNFVPNLRELIFVAILQLVELEEMLVTVIALKYALIASQ